MLNEHNVVWSAVETELAPPSSRGPRVESARDRLRRLGWGRYSQAVTVEPPTAGEPFARCTSLAPAAARVLPC